MELTQEYVRSLLDYKDGKIFWKVKRNKIKLGAEAGFVLKSKGERRRSLRIDGKFYLTSRIIFLYHHGWLPPIVDHKDRNTLNDLIDNLRSADYFKNNRNCTSVKGSTSKYLGVSFKSENGKWVAQIRVGDKPKHLGYFGSQEMAALAYNNAASIHYGEFANLNIINQ